MKLEFTITFTINSLKYMNDAYKPYHKRYLSEKKLKMKVEKEEILLQIILKLNSTLVFTKIMKKEKRKKRRAIWIKDWLKRRE